VIADQTTEMASPFVSQSAVLYNVQFETLQDRVSGSLKMPSVAVPLPVLPIFSEDGGFLTLQLVATSTSNRDEV
jgi:hypothetical protein